MSMTLILWKAPVVSEPEDAKALLTPWYVNGDESAFESCAELGILRDQLIRSYPLEPAADPTNPWADGPEGSDRLLTLSLRWGVESAILADVVAMARELQLVLYDPQGPDIFLHTDPLEELTAIPPPTIFEWFKAVAIPAALIALAFIAWKIPIGWVRWPTMVFFGFFAAAGLFVLGLLIASRVGLIKVDQQP